MVAVGLEGELVKPERPTVIFRVGLLAHVVSVDQTSHVGHPSVRPSVMQM